MDNIIEANGKQEHLLDTIGRWGLILFIASGIIGCNAMESGGTAFGWSFVIIGIILDFVTTALKNNLKKSGGALTKRELVEDDLRGLKKDDLERLRLHIYAKQGYNFNVNDGLYYLEKIVRNYLTDNNSQPPVKLSDARILCNKFGCDVHQLLMSYECRSLLSSQIDMMTEKERDEMRKLIESRKYSVIDDDPDYLKYFKASIGYYNRDGIYGHEGAHYDKFKDCDWYKPTTSNMEEVYSKMSEVEKYNVEFIKAHEAKCSD